MLDREKILAAAREKRAEMTRKEERLGVLEAFLAIPDWGSCSGRNFKVGDKVRLGVVVYECIDAHTFALLRSPLNPIYWRVSLEVAADADH